MGWVWLLLAVVCSNLGNLAVKSASGKVAVSLTGYLCPSFLAGGAALGLGLLFYARALAALPLAVAYPVLVGATATGTTMIALFIYHERVSFMNVAGIALILGGMVCLVATMAPKLG
jgi:quaternary ammonium compound-resistance protein SugE